MAFKKTSMTIFSKVVTYSQDIYDILMNKTSKSISETIDSIASKDDFNSYDDIVLWALDLCRSCLPSPFSVKHGYTLNLAPNYFTLTIPNEFRVGVKYLSRNSEYKVDIIYMTDIKVMENTTEYKNLVTNGWSVDSIPANKNQTQIITSNPAPLTKDE